MFLCKNLSRKCVRLAVFIALFAGFAVAAQAQVVFSPASNISNSPGRGPQVAVDKNGNINVVWLEAPSGGNVADVFFSRSTDGGVTFSTPLDISPGIPAIIRQSAEMALDPSGNINIVWTNEFQTQSGAPLIVDIYYTHSSDGGATFSAPLNLSQDGSGAPAEAAPLAVDSRGNICVVWEEDFIVPGTSGRTEVRFSHSTDSGAHFSTAITVSSSSNRFAEIPLMALDSNGSINIAYRGGIAGTNMDDVFFVRSSDQGGTFSTPINISNSSTGQGIPRGIAIDGGGGIYVMWYSGCTTCISGMLLTVSKDGGSTFSTSVNVPGDNQQLAVDFTGNINVFESQSKYFSGNPFNGTAVFQYTGFFARSNDGGATFSTPMQIATSYNGLPGQIVSDRNGNINIAAALRTDPASSNRDLYLLRSTDGGTTFSSTNVSNDGGYTFGYPAIAMDLSGNIGVAWPDGNSGNGGIFFSRGTVLSLSALGLSSSDLTGGSSSTGTVTLSGPAATGGTVISLSSSDPSVGVPATVTVAEGATSATFAVTTNPVAAATTATVSAVLGGVTQTASITVEPPVLTSLTLNPSSTMGGSSTTGTVALNGPAPAGGSVVALSNSNPSVASVPSSVTVAPGSTNVTFTVSTSRQLCPNSATVTASFSGVTFTTNLVVQPFVTLSSQACAAIGAHGGGPGQ